jgi:hypothetical protein
MGLFALARSIFDGQEAASCQKVDPPAGIPTAAYVGPADLAKVTGRAPPGPHGPGYYMPALRAWYFANLRSLLDSHSHRILPSAFLSQGACCDPLCAAAQAL